MSELKLKFLETAMKLEKLTEMMVETREELESIMSELGIGAYVQNQVTGTVYKVVKPKGTFTYYRDLDYTRTALEGERAGTLSKKEAEEAGFILKKA